MCLFLGHLCGRSSSCTCQERIWHAEKQNVVKQFQLTLIWFGLVHTIYIYIYIYILYICYFFRFDASPKELFVSCHYYVLFVCLAPVVFKVNTANIQYFWIFLDIQIMQDPLYTAVLTTIFFHDYSYQKCDLCFSFVDC